MSHNHFCDVMGHWFECYGKALRLGDTEPSVCICDTCGLPLEEGNHSQCQNLVELVSCPEHRDKERRRMVAAETKLAARRRRFNTALDEYDGIPKNTPESDQAWKKVMKTLNSEI